MEHTDGESIEWLNRYVEQLEMENARLKECIEQLQEEIVGRQQATFSFDL